MTTRVALVGGTGKLGSIIHAVIDAEPDFEVVAVNDIGEHRARFPGRGLQARLDPREAADPFVDKGEVVRVDADVELVPVRAVIAGMRVTVQQRNTIIRAWAVGCVPVGAVWVAAVRVVGCQDPVPAAGAFDDLGEDAPPGRLVQRGEPFDRAP